MLNKKEYLMLELVKMNGHLNLIDQNAIEAAAEWILQKGEAYQLELEEAERLRDDDNETFDLRSDEL